MHMLFNVLFTQTRVFDTLRREPEAVEEELVCVQEVRLAVGHLPPVHPRRVRTVPEERDREHHGPDPA